MFSKYQLPRTPRGEPKQLRSTKSYIYYTDDTKGEGATGSVYGGREKKSGEKVAVKVFNNVSFRRPGTVQEREFDVLLKLQHRNIVKLLAIEEDQVSKDRVIIMELCTGGSLFNVLDKPENAFGVEEAEFLVILGDVSSGMKHLWDKGIVHRDLKPGNIMCCYGPDGSSIYKLADFGAARELAVGENFVSLYGTEEYLHPDVYERAVLHKPLVRPFTSSVDLWSIGVTLFHAATGALPFRPYGGRTNRTTMHKMTSLKSSGIISGVQKESENGPIEWSNSLPKTIQLSRGLGHHVEELLAGLLESDVNKAWSFETFLSTARSIVNKRVIDVFYPVTSQLLKVYIEPTYSLAEFQEHIAIQTSIQSSQQLILYEDAVFYPDSSVPCSAFPETSPDDPIFLFRRTYHSVASPFTPETPNVPPIPSRYSLENDAPSAKRSVAALIWHQRNQKEILLKQKLQDSAVKILTNVIKDDATVLKRHSSEIDATRRVLAFSLEGLPATINTALQFAQMAYRLRTNGHRCELDSVCDTLRTAGDEIGLKRNTLQELSSRNQNVTKQLGHINHVLFEQDSLKNIWTRVSRCQVKDKCEDRFDVLMYQLLDIYSNFVRDSKNSPLPFNSEQIHKMEKLKFNELLVHINSLVQDHCESKWHSNHTQFMHWCSFAFSLRGQISEVDTLMTSLVSDFSEQEIVVSKLGERCRRIGDNAVSDINAILQVPTTVDCHTSINRIHITSAEYKERVPYIDPASVSLHTSSPPKPWDTRQCLEAATQTDMRASGFNQVESGSGIRVVPVPLELKRGLSEWEENQRATLHKVWQSQELVDGMRNLSVPDNADVDHSLVDIYGAP